MFAACKKNHPPTNTPVPPVKSSEKLIKSFAFKSSDNSTVFIADVGGIIGADTITVTVNQGINVSNLVPTINYIGVDLSPATRVAQNFTNLVTYTVTAEDGSTKRYVVKIVFVRANQKIYIGSDDGNLYALNANTGNQIWKYTTGGAVQSSPTVVNNTVYFGSTDKYLYAIDATNGTLKWKYLTQAPIRTESPVVSNGLVFISCSNNYPSGYLYGLNASTGALVWTKSMPGPTTPAMAGGSVFVGTIEGWFTAFKEMTGDTIWSQSNIFGPAPAVNNGKLYALNSLLTAQIGCFDASNGNLIWAHECNAVGSGPTIDNGTVYVSSFFHTDQWLEAYNATTGEFKWKYTPIYPGNGIPAPPSCPVVLDSIAYPGFHLGGFYAVKTTTGMVAWKFDLPINEWFSNPTAANGVVYVGNADKYVYALDAVTGVVKWKFLTGGAVYSGACIVDSDGMIFYSGASGAKN